MASGNDNFQGILSGFLLGNIFTDNDKGILEPLIGWQQIWLPGTGRAHGADDILNGRMFHGNKKCLWEGIWGVA